MADVVLDDAAIERLLSSPAGPVGEFLARLGKEGTRLAKGYAPVSPKGSHGRRPGHLRSVIGWRLGRDTRSLYVDIYSPARTADGRNFPYGLAQSLPELRGAHGGRIRTTPHLQPAFRDLMDGL